MSKHLTTVIDLMRHGEPIGGRRYRGRTDDPLSEKGWAQMRAAVGTQPPWEAVVSSSLTRCRAFAEELSTRQGIPLTVEPRLVELGYGSWEGRTPADILAEDPGAISRFFEDPFAHQPHGAEPLAQFEQRVLSAWAELLACHRGRHVLVIAHAGTVRLIVSHVLSVPLVRMFRIHVPTAALTRIEIEHNAAHDLPRLIFHAGRL